MSKSDEGKLREQTLQDRSRVLGQGKENQAAIGKLQAGSEQRAGELYPGLKSGLQDFATTGGYTPGDISNIRSRSTSVVPQIYSRMTEQLRRRGALSGGYQPGYGANLASMGRSAAELGGENARDTEIGISQAVRQNKMAGLGGLQGLYGSERGDVLQTQGLGIQAQGMQNDALANIYRAQLPLASRPGAFQNIMQGIGTVSGALKGGGIPQPPQPANYSADAEFNAGLI